MESYHHHTRVLTPLPTPHPDIRAHITNAPLYRYRTLFRYTQSVEAELLHLLYQWLPQVRAIPAPRRAPRATPPRPALLASLPYLPRCTHRDQGLTTPPITHRDNRYHHQGPYM